MVAQGGQDIGLIIQKFHTWTDSGHWCSPMKPRELLRTHWRQNWDPRLVGGGRPVASASNATEIFTDISNGPWLMSTKLHPRLLKTIQIKIQLVKLSLFWRVWWSSEGPGFVWLGERRHRSSPPPCLTRCWWMLCWVHLLHQRCLLHRRRHHSRGSDHW